MTDTITATSPATTDRTEERTPRAIFQIFHIFRKDARHHWPEILISLLVLAAYTWHTTRQARAYSFFTPGYLGAAPLAAALAAILPLLLVTSWFFLIFRVVQDESLIGDRQFWVTRPYRWPSLLAAKVLFLVAFVHFPLFVAQSFLLRQVGFPVIQNFGGLAAMHIPLALALLFPLTIAVLTRSVTQALIATLAGLILFLAYGPALSEIPNHAISGLVHSLGDTIKDVALPLALIAVILWQYARRRIVLSAAVLLCLGALIALIDVATPYRTFLERQFPLPDSARPAPAKLTVLPPPPRVSGSPAPPWYRFPNATIRIPLRVSGVAQDSVVAARAMLVSVQGPSNFEWHANWTPQWLELWPDSTASTVQFTLERNLYDQIRSAPVRLRLTLALSQYTESSPRQIVLPEGLFPAFGDGYCWQPGSDYFPALTCRTPVYRPGFVASTLVVNASCSDDNAHSSSAAHQLVHHFVPSGDSAGALNPVQTFSISLQPPNEIWQPPLPHLCPGTTLHLATPVASGQWRITVEADQIKLEDYSLDTRSGPTAAHGLGALSLIH